MKVTSYTWTVGGDAFKNYDPTLASNQLVPLGSTDSTGPAQGSTSVAPLLFYDRKAESLTVTCNATLTAPDGTSLSVKATSPSINVVKPTATWTAQAGYIQRFTLPGHSDYTFWGLYQDPQTSQQFGMNWTSINFAFDSPCFSPAGEGSFTQLVTPNVTLTSYGTTGPVTGVNNGVQALDNAPNVQSWNLPETGSGGDDPAVDLPNQQAYVWPGNVGDGYTNKDAFQTWLMYMPPSVGGMGTVWVPIQTYSWNLNFYTSWTGSSWSYAGYPPSPDQFYTPMTTDDPPQWSSVQSNVNYNPN